jgi:hypothetical protein
MTQSDSITRAKAAPRTAGMIFNGLNGSSIWNTGWAFNRYNAYKRTCGVGIALLRVLCIRV